MDNIIDLETEKKMRLSINDLLDTFWKFTVDDEPIELKTSHLRLINESDKTISSE